MASRLCREDRDRGREWQQKELLTDPSSEPPAVFIYMIDPLSYCVDNMELARLFSMDKIRCFSDIIRQSVYLQTVTLDTVYSVAGKDECIT